jgi:hypothetical protein
MTQINGISNPLAVYVARNHGKREKSGRFGVENGEGHFVKGGRFGVGNGGAHFGKVGRFGVKNGGGHIVDSGRGRVPNNQLGVSRKCCICSGDGN